jgi:AcrR family transcriptional regulator
MAWDTEATRRRLLEAGARQFAEHGYAGARVDAIGRDAGVNKERVYRYFGDKRGFFEAVLTRALTGLLDGSRLDGSGPAVIGEFAGWLFDRFGAYPALPRLLAWESLELDGPVDVASRVSVCSSNARSIQRALPGLSAEEAEHVLLSTVTLVAGWWLLDGVRDAALTGDRSDRRRRSLIVSQATALASGSPGNSVH